MMLFLLYHLTVVVNGNKVTKNITHYKASLSLYGYFDNDFTHVAVVNISIQQHFYVL